MPLPNSLPWMESTDAKMIRAHEQIETLERETGNWFASIDIRMYLKDAQDQPWPWLIVHASDYVPPVRLSVLAGECVHNIRSALDHLICGLALTRDRRCKCAGIAFPVLKDLDDWNKRAESHLKGVPAAAKDVIQQLQPWVDATRPHPLVILNKLSRIDKHRTLNFTAAYNRDTTFTVHCNDGTIFQLRADKPQYLGDVQTFTLPIGKQLVRPSAHIKASGTSVLTFREESDWDDVPVRQVLLSCFDYIEKKVIANLRAFFNTAAV